MSDVEYAYENWLTEVKPFPLCDTDPCAFRAGYAAAEADLREARGKR